MHAELFMDYMNRQQAAEQAAGKRQAAEQDRQPPGAENIGKGINSHELVDSRGKTGGREPHINSEMVSYVHKLNTAKQSLNNTKHLTRRL